MGNFACGLWNPEKFCLWNPESCTSEYKETGLSYDWNDKETNPVEDPGFQGLQSRIQDCLRIKYG